MYKLDHFQTTLRSHNTPLEFWTTQEGGNFRVIGDGRYRIVRYDKKSSDMKMPIAKWMRSTVWDTESNLPLCVSPSKAEADEQPPCNDQMLLVQDFLDGTMVNLVFPTEGAPFLSTRSQIGASGNFYSQRSFAELFQDALNEENYTYAMFEAAAKAACAKDAAGKDVRSYFLSFLLQHPEHRVVARIQRPTIYTIQVGFTTNTGDVYILDVNSSTNAPLLAQTAPHQYPIVGFHTENDYNSFVTSLLKNKGWFWNGLTFKDPAGRRWRIRNPNYMTLRALRGSEALPLDRWLRLRSKGLVLEYLKHYSEERNTFWDFEQRLRKLTLDVYNGYTEVHKLHTKKLTDFPKNISPCIFRLHAHFLEHLKPEGYKVAMKDAIELINNMSLLDQRRFMTPPVERAPVAEAVVPSGDGPVDVV